jgi:hypothetical protein
VSTSSGRRLRRPSTGWAGESQGTSDAVIDGIAPGTYLLRLEALRTPEAGKILAAQTETATIVVP